jgi:putative transposase
MNLNQMKAKMKKRFKHFAKVSSDASKIAPNLLNQDFITNKADMAWVLDITYIKTCEGWLYVSAILDLYSRKIVGLSMGCRADVKLVIRSLDQAIIHRSPASGLILHSDRGVQYTSSEYKKIAQKNGFFLSMSAKGCCYDNAAMESFFHTLKTEHVFFHKFTTKKEAMVSIFEYIEVFYNRQRIHSTLNFMAPVEFEKNSLFEASLTRRVG